MDETKRMCPYFPGEEAHGDGDVVGGFCIKKYKIDYFLKEDVSGIPDNKRHLKGTLTIDQDGTDDKAFSRLFWIESNIKDYFTDGKQLFIYSSTTGNGKTSWAYRLLCAYVEAVWKPKRVDHAVVLFVNVPRYLRAVKSRYSKGQDEYADMIDEGVKTADLVAWDDIGFVESSDFDMSYLYEKIDSRVNRNLSNIYTSNLGSRELMSNLDARLFSRTFTDSEQIELRGKDKRGSK